MDRRSKRARRSLGKTKIAGDPTCPDNWSFAYGDVQVARPPASLSKFFAKIVDPE